DGKEDITGVISRVCTYQQTLTSLGFPINDTIYAFILLYTLPDLPKNANLWSMITSSVPKNEKLTFSHVEAHFTTNTLCFVLKKEAEEKDGYKGKAKANSAEEEEDYCDTEETAAAMLAHVHISQKSKSRYSAYAASEPDPQKRILLDSGASSMMVPHIEWFIPDSLKALNPPRRISFGDSSEVFAVAIGTIILE
ncbi:hypothetical protein FIBSPDRAFT_669537, partial [Athelia psychrophila]